MIATIKADSTSRMNAGIFEAIKHGLEYDTYADNTFDIIVHQQHRAAAVARACGGKIVAVVDKIPIFEYKVEG